MLDGFVLQVILTAVCFVVAVFAVVWFVAGINEKSANWFIWSVPVAVLAALIFSFIIS